MKISVRWVVTVFLLAVACGCQTAQVDDRLRMEIAGEFARTIPDSVVSADTNVVAVASIAGDGEQLMNSSLVAEFSRDPRFAVSERQTQFLEACEREKNFGLTDYVDSTTAARLGKLHGAHLVVVGRLWPKSTFLVHRELAAELRLVHVESGLVRHAMETGELRRQGTDWHGISVGIGAVIVLMLVGVLLWRPQRDSGLGDVMKKKGTSG